MNHIVRHNGYVSKEDRNHLNRHDSGIIWFTGLSASGKSTIAHHIEKRLFQRNIRTYVFDGDNIRHGLNSNLGFSPEDRTENLRRIVEVSKLFVDAGVVVLTSFITPLNKQRIFIRSLLEGYKFIEVYVKCDINECIRRDPKGLYKKAQAGIISNYTGISSPFEEPDSPECTVDTQKHSIQESVDFIFKHIEKAYFLNLDHQASGTAPQDKIRTNDV